MNYKHWVKAFVKAKDYMLNCCGGLAKEWEITLTNTFIGCPVQEIETKIELGENKLTLTEYYTMTDISPDYYISIDYILELEQPDGRKSKIELHQVFSHNLEENYIDLVKRTGLFDRMKPSKLPEFIAIWYLLCYDRRERENYNKQAS